MKKSIWLFPIAMIASVSSTMARAEAASEASEIAALRREFKELAEKNQKEIDTLKRQLRDLRAAGAQVREPKHETAQARARAHEAANQPQASNLAAAPGTVAVPPGVALAGPAQSAAAEPPPAGPRSTSQAAAPTPSAPAGGGGYRKGPSEAAASASDGVKVGMPEGRPTIATADGRLSFAIGGLVQFDTGGYFQNPNPNTQFPHLNDGVNLRRGRLYFTGKFDDFRVNITPDFGGSPDGSPTLFEANVNYTGIKPVTATIGYFHPFVSLEDATFPGNLLFLERPSIINIERSVAAGIQRASLGANAATDDYFASAYLTGPVFGAQNPSLLNGEQVGLIGRLAARPYRDEDWNLHAGFSGQTVFHPNINASGTPGVSRTTVTLDDEPELRIDFNKLVSTGPLSARGASVYGGELGASWRNFLVQGEFYQIDVTQSKLPSDPAPRLGFNGGYVEGGWVLTGEPIPYDSERAAWGRPKVEHPFSLADGGIGAWEIAARYSTLDLNSHVIPGVSQNVTGGVYGGQQQIAALALSWYPNDWLRFMLQFQYVDVNKLNSAGTVQIGQRFETLAARAQVAW